MSITRNSLKRPAAWFAAASLLVGAAMPALYGASAAAAGQVTSRSIQLSDSAPSGGSITTGVGSGTNVSYNVTFTAATTGTNLGAIVVDICDNTPLIGDISCTFPTGFSWGSATPTLASSTFSGVTGTWTASSEQGGGGSAATPQVLVLTNGTPALPTGPINFTVTGVTNPSTAITPSSSHTYYARILTFASGANESTDYTVTGTTRPGTGSLTHLVDDGGIAMSLTLPITVTARVMETLSLCAASTAYTGVSCAGPAGTDVPSITLGHGTNKILDSSLVDTASVYTQVSTNALNGYALYLRASNSCAGLSKDNGATCGIPAVNSGSATGAAISAGTAAFGAQVSNGVAVSGGTGTNTAVARWATTGSNYIMDNTTSNDNVGYTYGSKIISSTGQANGVNNTITFGATASPTTPAGIYTENFSLVGVGTF